MSKCHPKTLILNAEHPCHPLADEQMTPGTEASVEGHMDSPLGVHQVRGARTIHEGKAFWRPWPSQHGHLDLPSSVLTCCIIHRLTLRDVWTCTVVTQPGQRLTGCCIMEVKVHWETSYTRYYCMLFRHTGTPKLRCSCMFIHI